MIDSHTVTLFKVYLPCLALDRGPSANGVYAYSR